MQLVVFFETLQVRSQRLLKLGNTAKKYHVTLLKTHIGRRKSESAAPRPPPPPPRPPSVSRNIAMAFISKYIAFL